VHYLSHMHHFVPKQSHIGTGCALVKCGTPRVEASRIRRPPPTLYRTGMLHLIFFNSIKYMWRVESSCSWMGGGPTRRLKATRLLGYSVWSTLHDEDRLNDTAARVLWVDHQNYVLCGPNILYVRSNLKAAVDCLLRQKHWKKLPPKKDPL